MESAACSLQYKPDWVIAQKRWNAFWECAPTERPCLCVTAPQPVTLPPEPEYRTMEEFYFDPEYVTSRILRMMESTWFGGETVPSYNYLMAGYALGCGPGVGFAKDTVWHPKNWKSIDEHVPWHPGPNDPWRPKMEKLLNRIIEASKGKFLVGYVCQTMMNDLLAVSRGTEQFLIDLATDMDTCILRLRETLPLWLEDMEHFRALVDAHQPGCGHVWADLWSDQPFAISQSDMSCMVSKQMFESYALAEVDFLGEHYGRIWYHLDGPGAVRHLPSLLSRPHIRAIQYVPGDGVPPNGPHWMEVYRQVQETGRCLDITVPLEHVEYLVRHLSPEGLRINTSTATIEQGEELLQTAVKWCGSDWNKA